LHRVPLTFDLTLIGISPLLLPLRSAFVPFTLPNLLWFYTLEGTRVQGHKGIYSLTLRYLPKGDLILKVLSAIGAKGDLILKVLRPIGAKGVLL
jgi:hypothetical protein